MKKYTFDDIREKGLLLYEYVRGSHAYGLQKPDGTSDIDTGGIYMAPAEQLLGLGLDYQDQIASEKMMTRGLNLISSSNCCLNQTQRFLKVCLYRKDVLNMNILL